MRMWATFDAGDAFQVRSTFYFIVLEWYVDASGTILFSWMMNVSLGQLHHEPLFSVRFIGSRQTSVYLFINNTTPLLALRVLLQTYSVKMYLPIILLLRLLMLFWFLFKNRPIFTEFLRKGRVPKTKKWNFKDILAARLFTGGMPFLSTNEQHRPKHWKSHVAKTITIANNNNNNILFGISRRQCWCCTGTFIDILSHTNLEAATKVVGVNPGYRLSVYSMFWQPTGIRTRTTR